MNDDTTKKVELSRMMVQALETKAISTDNQLVSHKLDFVNYVNSQGIKMQNFAMKKDEAEDKVCPIIQIIDLYVS